MVIIFKMAALQILNQFILILVVKSRITQSAGAEEYTVCFSEEG